jgi:signal transduction histidine kinase
VPKDREEEEVPAGVVELQRDANEKLVLAALRANEEVDEAVAATRRAEDETDALRQRGDELRSTAAFRERLIAIIGHDLRNPLGSILMAGGLLLERGTLPEADALLVKRILKSSGRMQLLLDQLVDFTRARLGSGYALQPAPCDLGAICADIAEELRGGSSAELRLTTAGNLRGTWDAGRLSQALSNIVGNAVDHAAPGTPVMIHARALDDAEVAVEIENQGPTIPPDVLPVVFEAFRTADPRIHPRAGHLGLGLFIASDIARAHGGTISVRSSEGTTTFALRLPRAPRPTA